MDPLPDPIDELSRHDGEPCPARLPRASRETYGFGSDEPASDRPTLRRPREAWICRYDAKDAAPSDANGAWFDWVRGDTPRRLDEEELAAFSAAVEQLKPPPANTACTSDLGPRYLVTYSHRRDLTGVVVDGYGCGYVRLTGEPFTEVPGESSGPGMVAGVLADRTAFLVEVVSAASPQEARRTVP
ncbi:MAG: hypothetical protein ACRCYQ_02630 [Nocardioides sp.]